MAILSFHQKIYLALNVSVFLAGVVTWISLLPVNWSTIHKIGFFCDDTSIRYPHKQSSVSYPAILLGGMAVDLAMIFLFEAAHFLGYRWLQTNEKSELISTHTEDGEEKQKVQPFIVASFLQALTFLSGLSWANVCVLFLKITISRLKPDFLDVCRPRADSFDCAEGYVTDYECTEKDTWALSSSSHSFPSGHVAIAAFHAIFLALYIEARVLNYLLGIPKMVIQFVALTAVVYLGANRILDFRHHQSDVISGILLGVLFGYITARVAIASAKAFCQDDSSPSYHSLAMTEVNQGLA